MKLTRKLLSLIIALSMLLLSSCSRDEKRTALIDELQCDSVLHLQTGEMISPDNYYSIELADGDVAEYPEFYFTFTPSEDGEAYTSDKKSIKSNPNKIQLKCSAFPTAPGEPDVKLIFDVGSGVAVYDEKTDSLVFLKSDLFLTVRIKSQNSDAVTEVSIMAVSKP